MENLRATYRDDEDEEEEEEEEEDDEWSNSDPFKQTPPTTTAVATTTPHTENNTQIQEEPDVSDELSEDEISDDENDYEEPLHQQPQEEEEEEEEEERESSKPTTISEEDEDPPIKKQKSLSSFTSQAPETILPELTSPKTIPPILPTAAAITKKSKKKNNVWKKSTSRKGKKKSKSNGNHVASEDTVLITPIPRFPDKTDDTPDLKIFLSRVYKAEKVELSDDRLSAGSSKGYRMVRATRGVMEGAWYFEIKVWKLGDSGHTRLGWSTEKGDLQAPVGYDMNSFGYRDVDGSKVHRALREKYGEGGYVEGDVIGFYINLPDGALYMPKPPQLVWYKGQRYACTADAKEDPPKVVPGSEISFFKNGVCQGVAFKDLFGGRYYPAASMYTLPNQPNCVVKFNFGPDFELFPTDFDGRPIPKPMIEVPYHGFDSRVENVVSTEKKH